MIVAIDGPAASGKGTLARRLALHFNLPHLDTGLLYRATARTLIRTGGALDDEAAAVAAARAAITQSFDEAELRGPDMGEAASRVAALTAVRTALVDAQRSFAAQPGGAVLDGRDIGTVICPDADIKIFVTASTATRAARRSLELRARGDHVDDRAVHADIEARDARDAGRATAPLRPAADAVHLDTSALDVEQTVQAALALIGERLQRPAE